MLKISKIVRTEPFSQVAARLAGARRADVVLAAAQQIHALERTLKR